MTDKNKTEIVVVLDRSGSMASIRADMVGGFATFVEEQRKLPGECALSLYLFDDHHETAFEERPLAEVPELPLVPRGWTALYDGTARAINLVGARLKAKPDEKRPGCVVVMVITDGAENASKETTADALKKLIAEQQDKYGWRFMYLGADLNTIAHAAQIGIQASAQYSANSGGVNNLYGASGQSVGALRSAVMGGNANAPLIINPNLTSKN